MEARDTFVGLLTELATTSESQEHFDEEAETEKNKRIAELLKKDDLINYHLKFDDVVAVAVQKKEEIGHVITLLEVTASRYEELGGFEDYKDFFANLKKYAESYNSILNTPGETVENVETAGATSTLDRANDVLKRLGEETSTIKNDTLSTVLTVLGLFVAVIIAVVAVYLNGVADIKSLSESIASSISTGKLILFSSLRWHVTFLLIFFLIFLIAKLTSRSLASMCRDAQEGCDCSVCEHNCGKAKQILKRFPWFVLMNIAFFAVEFSALFVEIHGWSNIKGWFGLEFCDVNWRGIITDSAISHWILAFLPILVWILCKRLSTGGTAKSDSAEK